MPRPCSTLRQRLSPLKGLGVLLMVLALLLVAPLASSHAGEPADQAAPASLELASGEASPSDLPHCHHGHGARHPAVALPRVERQDIEFDTLHEPVHSKDSTTPIIASTGAPQALPDPSPVPVYLLTQRFRS
jgi:hypothetical protein